MVKPANLLWWPIILSRCPGWHTGSRGPAGGADPAGGEGKERVGVTDWGDGGKRAGSPGSHRSSAGRQRLHQWAAGCAAGYTHAQTHTDTRARRGSPSCFSQLSNPRAVWDHTFRDTHCRSTHLCSCCCLWLFTVRLEQLQEKSIKENNSLGESAHSPWRFLSSVLLPFTPSAFNDDAWRLLSCSQCILHDVTTSGLDSGSGSSFCPSLSFSMVLIICLSQKLKCWVWSAGVNSFV